MKIKTFVATRSDEIRQKLSQAHFHENKMEIVKYTASGDELLDSFAAAEPGLVIIDRNITGLHACECIRLINKIQPGCRILAIGDSSDGEFMYALLKLKIAGFLKTPPDIEELNEKLKEISEDIRRVTLESINYDACVSMQSLYFWKLMFENSNLAHDMDFINRNLKVHFSPGVFRAVLFRLDQIHGELPQFEQVEFYDEIRVIQQHIKFYTNKYFYEYCYEMIFDFKFNGVFAIINYNEKYDEAIIKLMYELQKTIAEYIAVNHGMTLTTCLGSGHTDFKKVYKSREEAYSVSWARRKKGVGKLLIWQEAFGMQPSYQQQLEGIVQNLKLTADTLNIEDFHKSIHKLFELPDFILTNYKSNDYILGFVDYFFDVNGDILSKYMNVEAKKEVIKKVLNYSYTLDNYQKNLEQSFEEMFEMLMVDMDKQNIRPIRKAVKYIKDNYHKQITAETLAELVNLSPVYFSHLFKKQIGMNMTDYVTEYRMEIAKQELLETDKSVYEISTGVGFRDQRYFSKRFKQITGKTPSEFRKMK